MKKQRFVQKGVLAAALTAGMACVSAVAVAGPLEAERVNAALEQIEGDGAVAHILRGHAFEQADRLPEAQEAYQAALKAAAAPDSHWAQVARVQLVRCYLRSPTPQPAKAAELLDTMPAEFKDLCAPARTHVVGVHCEVACGRQDLEPRFAIQLQCGDGQADRRVASSTHLGSGAPGESGGCGASLCRSRVAR